MLSLVTNLAEQENMKIFITDLTYLNLVIETMNPKVDHSKAEFKTRAIQLQIFLLEKMNWVAWPDYLHIGLAHTAEI